MLKAETQISEGPEKVAKGENSRKKEVINEPREKEGLNHGAGKRGVLLKWRSEVELRGRKWFEKRRGVGKVISRA